MSGAIVYWIDSQRHLKSVKIMSSQLTPGKTYESEALYKVPHDIDDFEVILMEELDCPSSIQRIDNLKKKHSKRSQVGVS